MRLHRTRGAWLLHHHLTSSAHLTTSPLPHLTSPPPLLFPTSTPLPHLTSSPPLPHLHSSSPPHLLPTSLTSPHLFFFMAFIKSSSSPSCALFSYQV
ncbi:hypothetical protein EYF80_063991 [Liparis tanakae]|uniref:Uncharacterized protein n=1 Tax=Liparis tanakae TaxID=230148 RepID=A0A4Z2EAX3_9TELE|nr:hypothetical protein EYF80_063991 [Liparis tanakae]